MAATNRHSKKQSAPVSKEQSLLRDAALELRRLRQELEQRDAADHEPIAIIGMACRFPGGVTTPEAYWTLLRDGVDAISEIPGKRWDVERYFNSDPEAPGAMYTRHGGFVDNIDHFDPQFFGISPREAHHLDPQQRLLLECAYEALENAGLPVQSQRGSQTGVYVGMSLDDYAQRSVRSADPERIDAHSALGTQRAVAAGRIAYVFGLQGPALQIDTTCSSSLVSVHLACQSLRRKETNMALAGGVNLMLSPEATIACCKLKALSTDGRCRTFAYDASGYGRGEGCGLLVLKRLTDAQADGDKVLAVIRGSAVNHDGVSNGLTAPNGQAQTEVVQSALADAGVQGSQIDYVEAHGTGTPLGDPIELEALHSALGRRERPLLLGSVKTNIGHLESAAGIAGLMKVILSMQAGKIPAHLHCDSPSSKVDWASLQFELPQQGCDWPRDTNQKENSALLAGISGFGMSGTNAHIILESAPVEEPSTAQPQNEMPRPSLNVFTLSARSREALPELAQRYVELLQQPGINIAQVCAQANSERSHYNHRRAFVAANTTELSDQLRKLAVGEYSTASASAPRVVFLFTGQGAQYRQMGRALYDHEPVFRRVIDTCDKELEGCLPFSLSELLYADNPPSGDPTLIDNTGVLQPLLFALQYALTELWASWGLRPNAVLGHSVGEFAAACCAGVMPWLDGLKLIAARAKAMQALPGGAMLSVAASAEKVMTACSETAAVAAFNGPHSLVLAGDQQAIDEAEAKCKEAGIRCQRLAVSHAFHSPMMASMQDEFQVEASGIDYAAPDMDWVSTVNGRAMGQTVIDGAHWVEQLCAPVYFQQAISQLNIDDNTLCIEIGPQATLLGMAKQCLQSGDEHGNVDACEWLPSLRPPLPESVTSNRDYTTIYQALARVYELGFDINWSGLAKQKTDSIVRLPNYPFARESYWLEPPDTVRPYVAVTDKNLPGRNLPIGGGRLHCFEMDLAASDGAHWSDHKVQNKPLWPAAGHIASAVMACLKASDKTIDDTLTIEKLKLRNPLWLNADKALTIQTQLTRDSEGVFSFEILRQTETDWQRLSGGEVSNSSDVRQQSIDPNSLLETLDQSLSAAQLYESFSERQLDYGPVYQRIEKLSIGQHQALAKLSQREEGLLGIPVEPCIIDAGLQAVAGLTQDKAGTLIPVGIDKLSFYSDLRQACWVYAQASSDKDTVALSWLAEDGQVLAALTGLHLHAINTANSTDAADKSNPFFLRQWVERPLPLVTDRWLPAPQVIASSVASPFAEALQATDALAYQRALPELDRLAVAYMAAALSKGDELNNRELLAEKMAISQSQRALFNCCYGVLSHHGWSHPEADDLYTELASRYPETQVELNIIRQVGTQLRAILCGDVDPLSVLFPDGDGSMLYALYADSPGAKLINGQLIRALDALLDEDPGRPLRVLEIGAGTGGTTVHVLSSLNALNRDIEYQFTDISPQLVQQANQRFADVAGMAFHVLDIEQAPNHADNNLNGHYDLVIASNVLHATVDLIKSLTHVRQLLAPGGQIVLLEGTSQLPWLDLVFGVTEGWWRFQDHELRPDHPLLSVDAWHQAFAEAGFESSEALQPLDVKPPVQTVLLAQAPVQFAPWSLLGKGLFADKLVDTARQLGLEIIHEDKASCQQVLLLLEPFDSQSQADTALNAIAHDSLQEVFTLVQNLVQGSQPTRLCVLAYGDDQVNRLLHAPLWGLLQAVALEQPSLKLSLVISDDARCVIDELCNRETEAAVSIESDQRRVARLEPIDLQTTKNRRLVNQTEGTLDGLAWQPQSMTALDDKAVEIAVHASGLNFRDVLIALGIYPEPGELGCECAGEILRVGSAVTRVQPGQQVMAIGAGCFADKVQMPEDLVAPLPKGLDWDAAATLPVCFATAAEGLLNLAQLQTGERVLIHNATGGVGQAALQIARQMGAEVYASASKAKWPALRELGIDTPLNSRDPAFAEELISLTEGQGVDVVLNSLPGDMRQKSLDVLADKGRFIEIGKGEGITQEEICEQRPDVSHDVLDLAKMSQQHPADIARLLDQIYAAVNDGHWQPLPMTTYEADNAPAAFRALQQAGHIGKLVIRAPSLPAGHVASEKPTFKADASYLITGGLGGLGLAVANWMAERGARHLLLMGRSAELNKEQQTNVDALTAQGVQVHILQGDVSDLDSLHRLLNPWLDPDHTTPLRGLIHAAGVMHDSPIDQLQWEDMARVLAPKLDGGWHLHQMTEKLPLDFFVLFSSAAGLMGAPGQSNHAAANSFLDGLAEYRLASGLPALSIAWGPWSEIGAAVKYGRDGKLGALPGIGMLAPEQALSLLDKVWYQALSGVAILPIDRACFGALDQVQALPFFEDLLLPSTEEFNTRENSGPASDFLPRLEQAPVEERRALLDQHVCSVVARVLGLSPDRLDTSAGLFDLGLDSLTALELKNTLQRDLAIELPTTLVFDYPTVEKLLDHLAECVLGQAIDLSKQVEEPVQVLDDVLAAVDNSSIGDDVMRGDGLTDGDLAEQLDSKLDELDALLADDTGGQA